MEIQATRSDLQWPRRLFHFGSGVVVAYLYHTFFTHSEAVYLLGFMACMVYIFEQIRVNYPEQAAKFTLYSRYLLRAEEQLKESAQVPYIMGLLLTILSFPKPIAIGAILTLAIADPLSALIGIRFGQRKIGPRKTLEGSLAFFCACTASLLMGFSTIHQMHPALIGLCLSAALIISLFELIPIKIDDNLTIPLFTGVMTWLLTWPWSIATTG